MNTNKRVLKNLFSLSIAEAFSRIFVTVLTIYVGRTLGVNTFGQLTFATAFIAYFNLFADFGLTILGIRQITSNKSDTNRYGTNILFLQTILAVFLLLLLAFVLLLIPLDGRTKIITFLFGLSIIPFALNMSYIFQAHEKMESVAIIRIISQFGYLIIGFFLIFTFQDIITLPIAQFITAMIATVVTYFLLKKQIKFVLQKVDLDFSKKLLKMAIPFLIGGAMIQIYSNMDTIMLQFIKGEHEVGLYNAAYKIINLLLSFSAMYAASYFPVLVTRAKTSHEEVGKTLHKILANVSVVVFPILLGGAIVSKQIMLLVWRSNYEGAYIALSLLFFVSLIGFLNTAQSNSLTALDNQKQATLSTVVGATVNMICNFILIPRFGFNGAAVATILAEFGVCCYLAYNLRNYFSLSYIFSYFKYAVLSLPMILFAYFGTISNINIYIIVTCSALIYLITFMVAKPFWPPLYKEIFDKLIVKVKFI